MKLMLYSWNANNEQVLSDNLIRLGFEVIWLRRECRHYTRDMELAMEMIQQIHARKAEAVISFNYFPIISMVCHTCQIPYYAWVYDCPHFTLYAKQMNDECNHIGIFDREMVRQLEDYGISTVFHVPLAVDEGYFGQMTAQASQRAREQYRCDISFVGSLYTDGHNYYDDICGEDHNGAGDHSTDIDAVIREQCFAYHEDYLRKAVADGKLNLSVLQAGMEARGLMLGEDYFARPEDILMSAVLEKKVTVEERKALLTRIAADFGGSICDSSVDKGRSIENDKSGGDQYDFRLYTGSDTKSLPELDKYNHGMVDYHTQMPLVFSGSRINLNISLRSIHSGIPLRVLDIMACGGFVLSNWQPEIAENFEEGVEIVTFSGIEDCMNKIQYYLAHEEERKAVAAAGQRKVQEAFSYEAGLEKLI